MKDLSFGLNIYIKWAYIFFINYIGLKLNTWAKPNSK